MRVSAPPRATANAIRQRATARGGWAAGALLLVLQVPITVDLISAADVTLQLLPFAAIALELAALVAMFIHPGLSTGVVFLLVGGLASFVYITSLISLNPEVLDDSYVAVACVCIPLGLVGAVTGSYAAGIVWSLTGYAVAETASLAALGVLGISAEPGWGLTAIVVLYVAFHVSQWVGARMQVRMLPDFALADEEARRSASELQREGRTISHLHQTVLSDLAVIAHGPELLPERDRARWRRSIAAATGAPVDRDELSPSGETRVGQTLHAETGADGAESDFFAVVHDLQWRGLSIDVAGESSVLDALPPEGRDIMIGAVRAALENVLLHSGEMTADVFLDGDNDRVTVTIVDDGVGFDLTRVAEDRLGLRMAIGRQVDGMGGSARVWSSPAAGTSVVVSLPIASRAGSR